MWNMFHTHLHCISAFNIQNLQFYVFSHVNSLFFSTVCLPHLFPFHPTLIPCYPTPSSRNHTFPFHPIISFRHPTLSNHFQFFPHPIPHLFMLCYYNNFLTISHTFPPLSAHSHYFPYFSHIPHCLILCHIYSIFLFSLTFTSLTHYCSIR